MAVSIFDHAAIAAFSWSDTARVAAARARLAIFGGITGKRVRGTGAAVGFANVYRRFAGPCDDAFAADAERARDNR